MAIDVNLNWRLFYMVIFGWLYGFISFYSPWRTVTGTVRHAGASTWFFDLNSSGHKN